MRVISDAIFLVGVALMTAGVWQWSVPAAFVFAGAALVLFAFSYDDGNGKGDSGDS